MTTSAHRPPEPDWHSRCGSCGVKRTDPLADFCGSCGEPYALSNAPTGGNLTQQPCRNCGEPIYWVTMRKSGKPAPLNTKCVQIVTAEGETVRGYVSHFATCRAERRRR